MNQNIQSLKKLLNGIIDVDQQVTVTGISNDSRYVKSGDLFLAINGRYFNARQHIPMAIEQGAAAIIYENNDGYTLKSSITVPAYAIAGLNVWQGIIASRFYDHPSAAMRCIGVTGTNGKTSCTQWIAQALDHQRISCGVVGTLGAGLLKQLIPTGYTTPDPILLQSALAELRQQGANAVALEVSSHALAQNRLNGVHFDVAVFTQLSRDHLDYHGDMKKYAETKRRLFEWDHLKAAVINMDDPLGAEWAAHFSTHYPVITYSLHNPAALIFINDMAARPDGFSISVKTPWGAGSFHLPFLGQFNVSNALAVLGVLSHFDLPLAHSLKSLEALQPVPGRMEFFGGKDQPIVVVDYAHTPDALKNILAALRKHCSGRLWCVFGCGGDRDRGKRVPMAKIAEIYSDYVIVTNDNPRTESPASIIDDIMVGFSKIKPLIEMDRANAIAHAIEHAKLGDVVLIAGKGHEDYQIIGEEMLPFSDREHVRRCLLDRASAI